MHKALLLLSVFGSSLVCGQVNLVLNPSFEDTLDSNDNIVYPLCVDWWNPNEASSDYFTPFETELSANGNGGGGLNPVPCNGLGCMEAQNGQAYIGLNIYESTNVTKEYAQGFLSEPLLAGTVYCVSAWIAMAVTSGLQSCDFQVAFTSTLVYDTESGGSLNLTNYVDFDISGINGDDWTHFEGSYTAIGGEQYIYIGSNTPNPEITCVQTLTPTWLNNASYILVDNVSVRKAVVCDSGVGENDPNKQPFIFPNPSSGFATVGNLSAEGAELDLFDGMGRWCTSIANRGQVATLDMRPFEPGVYFLRIQEGQEVTVLKIIKQ